MMANEVLVSCYGSFEHDLAHIAMTPMKWFPEMLKWIFGEDNGNSVYVKIDELFGEWTAPNSQLQVKK